ncbi:MAG: hypothetical protein R2729_24465 [Bryobacteraceae bacterium]
MARGRIEQELERLAGIRRDPRAAGAIDALRKALGGASFVAAKAARIAADAELNELGRDLVDAFHRLADAQGKRPADPGCEGKKAIAEALRTLEHCAGGVFERGVRLVQMEPVCGGQTDTAAELRAICALGLVDAREPAALFTAVDLLADPEPAARIGGVKALGSSGRADAALALRVKALGGDSEPQVTTECLFELMQIDRRASFDFVARFLKDRDETNAEAAALALASTREDAALEAIVARWHGSTGPPRRSLLAAVASMRTEPSIAFLVSLVREGRVTDAEAALEALAQFRTEVKVRSAVAAAVAARGDDRVAAAAREARFGGA